MPAPKKIEVPAPFACYKLGGVIAIYEGENFYCNVRRGHDWFRDPAAGIQDLLDARAEQAADDEARRAAFRGAMAAARAKRAADIARQPEFAF